MGTGVGVAVGLGVGLGEGAAVAAAVGATVGIFSRADRALCFSCSSSALFRKPASKSAAAATMIKIAISTHSNVFSISLLLIILFRSSSRCRVYMVRYQ